jgi:hypothetical protein
MYPLVAWRVAHLIRLGLACPALAASHFLKWAEIRAGNIRSNAGRQPSRCLTKCCD